MEQAQIIAHCKYACMIVSRLPFNMPGIHSCWQFEVCNYWTRLSGGIEPPILYFGLHPIYPCMMKNQPGFIQYAHFWLKINTALQTTVPAWLPPKKKMLSL